MASLLLYQDNGVEWAPYTTAPAPGGGGGGGGGTPPPPSDNLCLVGAALGNNASASTTVTGWANTVGRPLTVRRIYFASSWPSSYATSKISAEAGVRRISMDFKPTASTTPTQLNTFLKSCNTAGVDAVVSLFHEPTDDFTGAGGAAAFNALIAPYIPVVRSNGYPHIFNPTNFSWLHGTGKSFWPGDDLVDQFCVDFYNQGGTPGTGTFDTLDDASSWASARGIPFGMCEWNANGGSGTLETQAIGLGFMNYVKSFFAAFKAGGGKTCDLTYFSPSPFGPTSIQTSSAANAAYIAVFQQIFDIMNGT
jgi:hypothetical protein